MTIPASRLIVAFDFGSRVLLASVIGCRPTKPYTVAVLAEATVLGIGRSALLLAFIWIVIQQRTEVTQDHLM